MTVSKKPKYSAGRDRRICWDRSRRAVSIPAPQRRLDRRGQGRASAHAGQCRGGAAHGAALRGWRL